MASVPLPGFEAPLARPRVCGVCADAKPITRLTAIVGETRDAPGVIDHLYICQDCLANALERLTGYRIVALLRRWDKMNSRPKSILGVPQSGD